MRSKPSSQRDGCSKPLATSRTWSRSSRPSKRKSIHEFKLNRTTRRRRGGVIYAPLAEWGQDSRRSEAEALRSQAKVIVATMIATVLLRSGVPRQHER